MGLTDDKILIFTKEAFKTVVDDCQETFRGNTVIIQAINALKEMLLIGKSAWTSQDDIKLPVLATFNFKIVAATVAKEMIKSAREPSVYQSIETFVRLVVNDNLKTSENPELKKKVTALKFWCIFWGIPILNRVSLKNLWYGEEVE